MPDDAPDHLSFVFVAASTIDASSDTDVGAVQALYVWLVSVFVVEFPLLYPSTVPNVTIRYVYVLPIVE